MTNSELEQKLDKVITKYINQLDNIFASPQRPMPHIGKNSSQSTLVFQAKVKPTFICKLKSFLTTPIFSPGKFDWSQVLPLLSSFFTL